MSEEELKLKIQSLKKSWDKLAEKLDLSTKQKEKCLEILENEIRN